jgi:hypothetical protein
MKLSFAAVATVVAANQFPQVQFPMVEKKSPEKLRSDTEWNIAGVKGYYDGFYKSFYKSNMPETMKDCLNKETVDNVIVFETVLNDPFNIKMMDIQKDFNMFAEMAQIMENLSKCHFEESAFDIMTLCTKEPTACLLPKVTENLTKNMFVLIGKMTSLAETLQGFPSKEVDQYEEQMRELGSTGGTWARVMFDYKHHN